MLGSPKGIGGGKAVTSRELAGMITLSPSALGMRSCMPSLMSEGIVAYLQQYSRSSQFIQAGCCCLPEHVKQCMHVTKSKQSTP